MKLISRYNRVHLISTLLILLLSSVAYYFIIRSILIRQIDKDLKVEEEEILDYIRVNKALPPASDYKHQQIKFSLSADSNLERKFTNTLQTTGQNTPDPYRVLSFGVTVNGSFYKAMVYKSAVETEDLLRLIVGITAALLLLLLSLVFLINRFVLSKLWQPFFNTLNQLKAFDLNSRKTLKFPVNEVEEFHQLNQSVSQMAQRVNNEFENLKQFTENASHEIQTPLAIIRSKLDLLIQSSNAEQADPLQSIYNATERLTRLNQALLLLTKIGNNQYQEQETLDFEELCAAKFLQMDELIKSRSLLLNLRMQPLKILLNKDLADILLNNLVVNAIKHNVEGGIINVSIHENRFEIANTGITKPLNKDQIFRRFQKGSSSNGTGLGLAVVSEICKLYNIQIDYSFDKVHRITLLFNK